MTDGGPAKPLPASTLHTSPVQTRKLSFGCPVIDNLLGGGIDHIGITEFAGEAGAGKSQCVLQLMLRVQLPTSLGGLGGGAIYLHSDTATYVPAMKRLETLAGAFAQSYAAVGATQARLMDEVSVMQIEDVGTLERVLKFDVPRFLRERQVRLIVLDSIAALFRIHGDDGCSRAKQLGERAQQFFAISARLKAISDKFSVAVVVTNQDRSAHLCSFDSMSQQSHLEQVTDKPMDCDWRSSLNMSAWELDACVLPGGNGVRVPALGVGWGHCVNTRLILTRQEVRPSF